MATNTDKTLLRVIGLILLIGGAGVGYWGYQMAHSVVSEISRAMTGSLPDEVMYRYIGGAVCGVVGLFLLVRK